VYSFFIDGVRLPVAPSKINMKTKNMNKTVGLMDGGELNILKAPGLTDIDFDFEAPATLYPFAVYEGGFKPPEFYLDLMERLKTSKEPFQFIVSRILGRRLLYETNIRVSLEDYQADEDAKNGADLVIHVKLKQFVDRKTKRIAVAPPTVVSSAPIVVQKQSTAPERPEKKPAKTYTVRSGDTLWKICQRELGSGNKYPEIAKLNKIANPNKIFPGQVIRFE
jgi:LysM repeat protein